MDSASGPWRASWATWSEMSSMAQSPVRWARIQPASLSLLAALTTIR